MLWLCSVYGSFCSEPIQLKKPWDNNGFKIQKLTVTISSSFLRAFLDSWDGNKIFFLCGYVPLGLQYLTFPLKTESIRLGTQPYGLPALIKVCVCVHVCVCVCLCVREINRERDRDRTTTAIELAYAKRRRERLSGSIHIHLIMVMSVRLALMGQLVKLGDEYWLAVGTR